MEPCGDDAIVEALKYKLFKMHNIHNIQDNIIFIHNANYTYTYIKKEFPLHQSAKISLSIKRSRPSSHLYWQKFHSVTISENCTI